MAELTTCIGCGRRDTRHPSKLCGMCARGHVQNANAPDEAERARVEDNQLQAKGDDKRRLLPGPREDECDLT